MVCDKVLIYILGLIKFISTYFVLTNYTLYNLFVSFCFFTLPFSCSIFYDNELVANYGKIILLTLLLLMIMWFLFFIFLLFKKTALVNIAFVLFVIVNCFDVACVVYSLIQAGVTLTKIINLIFSLSLIVITILTIIKSNKTRIHN